MDRPQIRATQDCFCYVFYRDDSANEGRGSVTLQYPDLEMSARGGATVREHSAAAMTLTFWHMSIHSTIQLTEVCSCRPPSSCRWQIAL